VTLHLTSTTYNSSVTYRCLSGYWFYRDVFTLTSTCQANGQWSQLKRQTCNRKFSFCVDIEGSKWKMSASMGIISLPLSLPSLDFPPPFSFPFPRPARVSGERCELPLHQGPGQNHGRKRICVIFFARERLWWQQYFVGCRSSIVYFTGVSHCQNENITKFLFK